MEPVSYKPRLLAFSDRTIFRLYASTIVVVFTAFAADVCLTRAVDAVELHSLEPKARAGGVEALEYLVSNTEWSTYLGFELTESLRSRATLGGVNSQVLVHVKISSPCRGTFHDQSLNVHRLLIALVEPSTCGSYTLTLKFTNWDPLPSDDLSIQLVTTHRDYRVVNVVLRAITLFYNCALLVYALTLASLQTTYIGPILLQVLALIFAIFRTALPTCPAPLWSIATELSFACKVVGMVWFQRHVQAHLVSRGKCYRIYCLLAITLLAGVYITTLIIAYTKLQVGSFAPLVEGAPETELRVLTSMRPWILALFMAFSMMDSWHQGRSMWTIPYRLCKQQFVSSLFFVTYFIQLYLMYPWTYDRLVPNANIGSEWVHRNQEMGGMLLPQPEFYFEERLPGLVMSSFMLTILVIAFLPQREAVNDVTTASPVEQGLIALAGHRVESGLSFACAGPIVTGQSDKQVAIALDELRMFCHCSILSYRLADGKLSGSEVSAPIGKEGVGKLGDLLTRLSLRKSISSDDDKDMHVAVFELKSSEEGFPPVGIVAFRGTASQANVAIDADIRMVPWASAAQGAKGSAEWWPAGSAKPKVHSGFKDTLPRVFDQVVDELKASGCKHVWLTGHSLGGGMATLMAPELLDILGYLPSVCTFGAPPAGDRAWAQMFHDRVAVSVRVVCDSDPIPLEHVCGINVARLQGWRHVGGLIRLTSFGHFINNPSSLEEWIRYASQADPCNTCVCHCLKIVEHAKAHSLLKSYDASLVACISIESFTEV